MLATTLERRLQVTRVSPRYFLQRLSRMQNIDICTIPRASRRIIDEEVVEDSEPEREALRQTQKEERKRKKLTAMNELAATAAKASLSAVIVISDDSVPASPVAASGASLRLPRSSVIDISDSSISVNQNVISIISSASTTNPNATAADKTNASAPISGHSGDEEIRPTLNIGRFAWNNPRPLGPRNSASTLESASSSDSQPKPAAKKTARTASKGAAEEFSDADLKKLVKCVSCELSWTSRKTGAQKILHIRSCAKKTGLTDDTVRFLIKKELDNTPNEPGPSKRNGKATLVPVPRTTLLEDIVRDAGPKRKGKRKEAVDILKSVSETRENIRGKARMILGSEALSDGEDFIVHTQAVTASKPAAVQENCATQAFEPSRLGQQHGYRSTLLGEQDFDNEPDLPPATQAFAPSKLGGRAATGGWGYESDSESESSALEINVPATENPLDFPFSSAKEVSPTPFPRATKNKIVAAPTFPIMESDSDHAAYVHFDPELELNPKSFLNTIPSGKPKKNKKTTETPTKTKTKSPKAKGRVRTPSDADDSPRPSSPKAKARRTRKKAVDEFDEGWELGLKEKILADQDLHFRILRYEPINFDIFVKLASEEEPTARLKLKLRVFLDKQAINFYGGEATARSRTKRR
ncbi:hypothetical protein K438DRAFT_782809 [Mycena galopus ATCC 62051]|nr:hypothetical protein K438DRAFT_782809 [Mycena galopus ATCC 62051]